MGLHIDESGVGPRVAVLLHGMMGSFESWWRVAPLLVSGGYRVLAIDLPGHGLSDRDRKLTVERAADAVAAAVDEAGGARPALAIGHSFGGLVLAAASARLAPELAVFVDAPFASRGGRDRVTATAEYDRDRRHRSAEELKATKPYYSEYDCMVEARAAERFDPATAGAVAAAGSGSWYPVAGSIVVRANPSNYVSDDEAAALTRRGVLVRDIAGAAHSVWYSNFDDFVSALPEAFASAGETSRPDGSGGRT
ncbi:alpha/beta fold hydrolase [Glaciihabitans sp. dw_435]|uniref:alpha/beta fold hydrolase n=1 Tax=Glaciihabitans sp. dw_435 TaxID=2720081 RepID=UPI00210815CF|nr:alpha/beta hydrolase family protein [Glaciihabitans sp. dw_435]